MELNDIECAIENAEKNTGQLVEKKEEIESHEAHLQNAINKLEQDVQISKLLIEEKNDFSEQKSEIEQEIEKYKSEIIEIQDELNLMLSEAEENMRTLEDLEAVGEDVSETVNILIERKELIVEYEEQLKEIMDRLGMDFESNQFEQKTDLSSNNTSPSMPSNSQEYQIANPDISDHKIQSNTHSNDDHNTGNSDLETNKKLNEFDQSSFKEMDDAFNWCNQHYEKNSQEWQEYGNRYLEIFEHEIIKYEEEYEVLQKEENNAYNEYKNYIYSNNLTKEQCEKDTYCNDLKKHYISIKDRAEKLKNKSINLNQKREMIKRNIHSEVNTTFLGFQGDKFIKSYSDYITQKQGMAVPGYINTCSINSCCSMFNQQTGSRLTEKDGISFFKKHNLCEFDGGTYAVHRKKFFELCNLSYKYVLASKFFGNEVTLSNMIQHFKNGESIGLSIKGEDLCQKDIANRRFRIKDGFVKNFTKDFSNHSVVVAGFSLFDNGEIAGIWVNDTAYGAGSNRVFISKEKFQKMQRNTKGFSVEYVKGERRNGL